MSRLSSKPLDIHKKPPIVQSIKNLDIKVSIRSRTDSLDNLVKAGAGLGFIPTPQYLVVDSYERDYPRSFVQPPSYIRRSESAESYDLDSDDEHWLLQFNSHRRVLPAEKFEMMLYKLEIMDHKAAEKQAGTLTASVQGSPIPVVLSRDLAIEILKSQVMNRPAVEVLGAVYDYWKAKRQMWQKPILRRLQPPPAVPVNDTLNPFNVFRPREKMQRPHSTTSRRRQIRSAKDRVRSYEKLRQIRNELERFLKFWRHVERREEMKREMVEVELHSRRLRLLRLQASPHADTLRMEDGLVSSKFGRAEDGHRFSVKRCFSPRS